MSFLPYAAPSPGAWLGSLGFSAVAHAGMASVIFFSGSVALLPEVDPLELEEETVAVSLQILDADLIDEPDIPEDAVPVTPDAPNVEEVDAYGAPTTDELDLDAPDEATPEAEPDPILETVPDEVVESPLETGTETPVEEVEADTADVPDIITEDVADVAPAIPEAQPLVTEPATQPEPLAAPEEPVLVEEPVLAEPITEEPAVESPVIDEVTEPEAVAVASPQPVDGIINPIDGTGGGGAGVDTDGPDLLVIDEGTPAPAAPTQVIEAEPIDQIAALPGPVETIESIETTPAPELEVTEDETQVAAAPEPAETDSDTDTGTDDPEIVTGTVVEDGPATTTTTRPALQNPTAQDIVIGRLIRRIRALPPEACTLALPRRVADPATAGLAMIGADAGVLDRVAAEVVEGVQLPEGLTPPPIQSRDLIDPRQCAALDALRQSTDYPVSRIGLSLDSAALTSGDTLTARVIGAGGLFLTLLVVDDNGVVQDLAPFTRLDGDTPVIEVPVARAGPTRATRQLLLALGTVEAPLNLQGLIGDRAQDVFTRIPPEQLEGLVFSVVSFDVR